MSTARKSTKVQVHKETQSKTQTKTEENPGLFQKVGQAVSSAVEKAEASLTGLKEKGEHVFKSDKSDNTSAGKTDKDVSNLTETKETKGMVKPSSNRGVVFNGAGKIEVKSIPYPEMVLPWNKEPHTAGAILRVLTSAICGSDLHPYRGRTPMQPGTVLGHEFLGEIVEIGPGVQTMQIGDWGAVPFNVSCGTCASCKELRPETCDKTSNQKHNFGQGGIYGYVCGGDWQGGQAEYVFVPWVDYNFLKFDNKTLAKQKLLDLTLLTDVLPTAFHGTEEAHVEFGKSVYIAGAGPIGLAAAAICNLRGAARVIVSDFHTDRLDLARRMGCLTIDLNHITDQKTLSARVKELNGSQWCDSGIECVGYEARGFGSKSNVCSSALDGLIEVVKPGGYIGILGAFFAGDPKAPSAKEKAGFFNVPLGMAWMKGQTMQGGQASCMRYMRKLEQMIMADKLPISKILNVNVVTMDEVADAYSKFDEGVPNKFIIDVGGVVGKRGPVVSASEMIPESTI